ncbi:MAG: 16S rRNA (cytosine(1402)-N(4))-methyltransferase RsmH [Ignavibacteriales bacterium]|nr:16S rRNA (cytosine(1402)-N(4))-methyltransferase RsmH [Ignavibacteriales bacterium]
MSEYHVPVMVKECTDFLLSDKEGAYFEGTIGFGGHTEEFLKILNRDAKLIATELDEKTFLYAKNKFAEDARVKVYKTNFADIDKISKIEFIDGYDGVFADLGVSSYQLDDKEAGFTYRNESALDLRMDKSIMITAADIVNSFSEEDLSKIFFEYGEDKDSRKIAKKIVERRTSKKIVTTLDLSSIIEEIVPAFYLNKILSKIFQALRIYINNELDVLKDFLKKAVTLLKDQGNIVILTYHSLEDRIVKDFFKYESLSCVCPANFPVCVCDKVQRLKILTKKPIIANQDELKINRRARSAKLRVAKRI